MLMSCFCAIFNRKPTHLNDHSMFPLVLAPLHDNNLITPATKHHDLLIILYIHDEIKEDLEPSVFSLEKS